MMDILKLANEECNRIRRKGSPYQPPIQSTQVLGLISALQKALDDLENKINEAKNHSYNGRMK